MASVKSVILALTLFASAIAPARAVQLEGADFLVGTWTRDGDCSDGDVVKHEGDIFHSVIRGQRFVGTVQRDGDVIKTDFKSDNGHIRRSTYRIEGDNRLRVTEYAFCDRVHCESMHVQSFFFFMRCGE